MKYRSQDYECPECGLHATYLLSLDLPSDASVTTAELPPTHPCDNCDADAAIRFSAPAIMERALPDGTSRGDSWKIGKEVARLKKEQRNLPWNKRGEYTSEIKKLEKKQTTATTDPHGVKK